MSRQRAVNDAKTATRLRAAPSLAAPVSITRGFAPPAFANGAEIVSVSFLEIGYNTKSERARFNGMEMHIVNAGREREWGDPL